MTLPYTVLWVAGVSTTFEAHELFQHDRRLFMAGVHTYIRKRIGSYRVVSRRPRQSKEIFNTDEQTAAVRVPSPVTLVPLDKLHEALPDQQATEDFHLTVGDALHTTGDMLVDIQEPTGAVAEQES